MTDQSKEISFIISSLSGGGAEGVCVNIANGLADIGWNVTLIVLHLNDPVYQDKLNEKVNLVVLGVKHARHSFIPLYRHIKNNKLKMLVAFNYELAVILQILKTFTTLNYFLIARNINTLSKANEQSVPFLQHFIYRPIVNHFYRKVNHIINQCEGMRRDLVEFYPELKNRTSVIYNPVNQLVEEYADKTDLFKLEKQDYILCVGRLEKQKAFHYAIEAFAKISYKHPTVRLKLVGKGSLENSLKEQAGRFGVADRVDFEGFKKDTIQYYIYAKATLLTSLYEGFPNVLIESITLGTPVIAFNCKSGPDEIVIEGFNGYLIDECNIEKTSKALDNELLNPLERNHICLSSNKYKVYLIVAEWEKLLISL